MILLTIYHKQLYKTIGYMTFFYYMNKYKIDDQSWKFCKQQNDPWHWASYKDFNIANLI